jgi:membrane protein
VRRFFRIPVIFHRAALNAVDHDCFNLSQSAAYSAMIALFPAMIVAATIVALLPDTAPVRSQLGSFFVRILPPDVLPLLQSYFDPRPSHPNSARVLMPALLVSITGASSVIAAFMEGIRRANRLPESCWTFLGRRARAFLLVPLSLIPLAIASVLVVFGHIFTSWIAMHVMPSVRTEVFIVALIIRWTVALTSSVGLIALIYHMGTPIRQPWRQVIPGAITATVMWLPATLIFGWYVTRFANYTRVYGSLGVGIALLFWLDIISLCVLCGAEFNHEYNAHISPTIPSHSNA